MRALAAFLPRPLGPRPTPSATHPIAALDPPAPVAADVGDEPVEPAASHAASETDRGLPEPLSAAERRARATALRGLLLARGRRFARAQAAFAEAARLDPGLDLSTVPTFWELERGGHEAVIRAYRDAGREGDAAALAVTVRQTFRPRIVRPSRDPVSTAP